MAHVCVACRCASACARCWSQSTAAAQGSAPSIPSAFCADTGRSKSGRVDNRRMLSACVRRGRDGRGDFCAGPCSTVSGPTQASDGTLSRARPPAARTGSSPRCARAAQAQARSHHAQTPPPARPVGACSRGAGHKRGQIRNVAEAVRRQAARDTACKGARDATAVATQRGAAREHAPG